jgi:hypothetical protein
MNANDSAGSGRCAACRVGQILVSAGFAPCCQFCRASLISGQEFGRGDGDSGDGRTFAMPGGLRDYFSHELGGGARGFVCGRFGGRFPRFGGRGGVFVQDLQGAAGAMAGAVQRCGAAAEAKAAGFRHLGVSFGLAQIFHGGVGANDALGGELEVLGCFDGVGAQESLGGGAGVGGVSGSAIHEEGRQGEKRLLGQPREPVGDARGFGSG